MNDLITTLKQRLSLQEVIQLTEPLKDTGHSKMEGADHDALKVDTGKQVWAWWAQTAGTGKQTCGGDVLSWIAFQKFNTPTVEGDQFKEVLQEACRLAGIDFDEYQNPEAAERSKKLKQRFSILEKYVQACEWAADQTERFWELVMLPIEGGKVRKPYLTKEACKRWRIGFTPSMKQLIDFGLNAEELRAVDILRSGQDGDYLFFRNRMIIPYVENGKVVYLGGRALVDGPNTKKMLYLKVS